MAIDLAAAEPQDYAQADGLPVVWQVPSHPNGRSPRAWCLWLTCRSSTTRCRVPYLSGHTGSFPPHKRYMNERVPSREGAPESCVEQIFLCLAGPGKCEQPHCSFSAQCQTMAFAICRLAVWQSGPYRSMICELPQIPDLSTSGLSTGAPAAALCVHQCCPYGLVGMRPATAINLQVTA